MLNGQESNLKIQFTTTWEVTGKVKWLNMGDFVIYTVSTTCSCTASEWPKDPIKPGQYGKIKVTFDTRDKLGTYDKGVNLETNIGEINMIITVTVTK